MKICVSSSGPNLESQIDPRFGRCPYFIIVDSDTMKFEALSNSNISAMHGAGIGAAQIVANKGVKVVITGNIGPNAYQVLSNTGIKIITGVMGNVKDIIEKFKSGQLGESPQPTVPSHFGVGRGGGIGRGMGMERMKRGFPSSLHATTQQPYSQQPITGSNPEEEMKALEDYKRKLEEELEGLKARIKEIKNTTKN
ncbi:NifB/NifX family molybdenum-iron cluster-binding protein [[Eubacterium] cellulosolvens]